MRIPTILGLLILSAAPAAAQVIVNVPPPVPRDRVPATRSGSGVLRGRVVDGSTNEPIARARVRLNMMGVQHPAVVTGSNGEFQFSSLPPGPVSLTAEKATYLQTTFPDRGRTIRSASRLAVLKDGETIDDVVVRLYRGSAISGIVVDAYGDPVDHATVSAMRLVPGGQPETRSSTSTNDLGEFRVARLQAGAYVLAVIPRRTGAEAPPSLGDQPPHPIPTYYPGAISADQAQPITLERGQSMTGVEVVLAEGTPILVTGVVVRRDGEAVTTAHVNARSSGRGMLGMDHTGASVGADGTFRLLLNPGEYILQAYVHPTKPGPQASGTEQTGIVRVSVGAGAAESITIVTGSGASASGRVVFEGTSPPPPVPGGPLHIPLYSRDGMCRSNQAKVSADWTFRVDGLMGVCSQPPQLTFGRWTLKAVIRGGDDLLGSAITFESGQHLDNLQIVFTDRRSELTFRVSDDRGQVTQEYVALVFPTDKARWTDNPLAVRTFYLPPPDVMREMQRGAPAQPSGAAPPQRREMMGIPPGDYFVIAVDDIAHEDTRAPAILERLATSAVRVTIGEGAKTEVALRRLELREVLR